MFSYEGGLLLALLLWIWNSALIVVSVNSTFERNLNKIGQRLSWLTLAPKPMSAEDESRSTLSKFGKYLLIVGIGFPFIFLSWLYVAMAVAMFIYQRTKDSGTPLAVRELRWKLRNADLSFDQLVKELMKVSDESHENFETFRENIVRELSENGLSRG